MKRNKIFLFIFLYSSFVATVMVGQTFNDALRYSQLDLSGTARFMGSGASMSPLGADYTTMFTNPAGLALFRKSEIVITPGYMGVSTESSFRSLDPQSITESRNNFRLANAGLILASERSGSKWRTVNFGIGLNRMANYQQEFLYEGRSGGSIVDRFTALADGLDPSQLDDFEAGLAFDVGAIFGPLDGLYFNDFMNNPDHTVFKRQLVRQGGQSNELGISLAGNYDEKLMVGMTIGIPFYNYNFVKTYEEIDIDDEIPVFNNLEYGEFLDISGSGFNIKMGMIYSATQKIRLGLSLQTPTFMRISENFNTNMTYSFTDTNQDGTFSGDSPRGQFDYRIRTPFRVSGGIGSIIGSRGFLSADLEYVDYRSATFNFGSSASIADKNYERELNDDIRNFLKSAVNLRFGGELAGEKWRLRGGLLMDGSPFFNDNSFNFGYTLGGGIREQSFYVDLAYVLRTRSEVYSPYLIENNIQPVVDNTVRISQILLTVGFKI